MRSIGILSTLAILLSSGSVNATDHPEREQAAKKACLAGNPQKGVEILAELFLESNDINYLFNQGRCYEQNSRYSDAIGRFREYLLQGENRISPSEQAIAQKHIETCKSYLLDNEQEQVGEQALHPASKEGKADFASKTKSHLLSGLGVDVQPPQKTHKVGPNLRVTGIVLVTLGAVALTTGVFLNLKANDIASEIEKPDNFNRTKWSTRNNLETFGWIGYGVGAAGVTGGMILYLIGELSGPNPQSALRFSPSIGPQVAGGMLQGIF